MRSVWYFDRKPKLSEQQHTLKCTRNETFSIAFFLDNRIFRQARIFIG